MVLNELADTLASGETVKLSSFGSFVVRAKSERIAAIQRPDRSADHTAPRHGVQAVERAQGADQRHVVEDEK